MIEQASSPDISEVEVAVRALDGLQLSGTWTTPSVAPRSATVLVHGGGVTREEGGFFTRMAAALAEAGIASLRFDLRGHGRSEGRQEDLTLSAIMNDTRVVAAQARTIAGDQPVNVVGASFGGGICGCFAAHHDELVRRLVLLNPLVDYKKRFIDDKPYWHDDVISDDAGRQLAEQGFLAHSPSFQLGRPLLNEVFYLRPDQTMGSVHTPTLIVHGTKDTFIPVDSSRKLAKQIPAETRLVEIEGAQHGFAVHDDPQYLNPQTKEWQALVIGEIVKWLR
ncbi:MAG: alpha/beta hydrolase [Angustibacter sp.]